MKSLEQKTLVQKNRTTATAFPAKQKGFTLIELMIAGTLGLILIGGMIQIFLGSSQTFNVQRAISEVLDKGRTATGFIAQEIENAGFGGDGIGGIPSGFSTLPNNILFDGSTTNGTGAGNNDAIRIQYMSSEDAGGNFTRDCTGVEVSVAPFMVVNTFDVVGGVLRCAGVNGVPQPLIDGVESFHILYGVDTNGDNFADQYLTSNVIIAADQTNITTVRFSMVVSSQQERVFSSDVSRDYKVLDEAVQTFNDQRLRRKFTATVVLINKP